MAANRHRCAYCNYIGTKEKLVSHTEKNHQEMIPENYTAARVVFNNMHKKEHGICVVCKGETAWNEKTWKYNRLCGKKSCKETLRKQYKENMLRVHNTTNWLADEEHQKDLLAHRSISGTYKFRDGGLRTFTGSYERKALEFFDKVLEVHSDDIITPGPTLEYEFEGKKLHWITDILYVPANLIIEVKDGGSNPNNRSMIKYREKQLAKEKMITNLGSYNYLRLTDNNFEQLLLILAELKEQMLDDSIENKKAIININEMTVHEGAFISKNDLYRDFDKFENGESNVLLITGLTGSGKSTLGGQLSSKYNAEYIELDIMDPNTNIIQQGIDTIKKAGDVYYDFLDSHKKYYDQIINNKLTDNKDISLMMDKFIEFCFSYAKKNKNKKFIIEGIQIYEYYSYNKKSIPYPIIIKNTSVLKSFLRKIKREEWGAKDIIKNAPDTIKFMIKSDKMLKQVADSINEEVGGIPPAGAGASAYVIPYGYNRAFTDDVEGYAFTTSVDSDNILVIDDDNNIAVESMSFLDNRKYSIYECKSSDIKEKCADIYDDYKNKSIVSKNYFYEMLSGKELYTYDQIDLDSNFLEVCLSDDEYIKDIYTSSTIHEMKNAIDKANYFDIISPSMVKEKNNKLGNAKSMDIKEDEKGFFAIKNDVRSSSYKSINDIPDRVITIMDNIL